MVARRVQDGRERRVLGLVAAVTELLGVDVGHHPARGDHHQPVAHGGQGGHVVAHHHPGPAGGHRQHLGQHVIPIVNIDPGCDNHPKEGSYLPRAVQPNCATQVITNDGHQNGRLNYRSTAPLADKYHHASPEAKHCEQPQSLRDLGFTARALRGGLPAAVDLGALADTETHTNLLWRRANDYWLAR